MQQNWTILTTPTFDQWVLEQPKAVQAKVAARLMMLRQYGANLARPYADTVNGSRFGNMKELRIQAQGKPYRAFYAFDPVRQCIVLCCGDKSGDKQFYPTMIALADTLFAEHLNEMGE